MMRSKAGDERKPLVWFAGEVKTPPFSDSARQEAGELLARLQSGENLSLPHSRPMPDIGARCHELRVRDGQANWRVFYRVDVDSIVIIEVASKRTPKTPRQTTELCRRRLAMYDSICEES